MCVCVWMFTGWAPPKSSFCVRPTPSLSFLSGFLCVYRAKQGKKFLGQRGRSGRTDWSQRRDLRRGRHWRENSRLPRQFQFFLPNLARFLGPAGRSHSQTQLTQPTHQLLGPRYFLLPHTAVRHNAYWRLGNSRLWED